MGAKKNTVVRGCLVPSLKNKPLDGRQDVPKLSDIPNIENPYVNFIFPVAETGKWYKVTSLKTKVIDDLQIPDGEIDGYELFGEGLTEEEKKALLTKELAEQTYLSKDDASKNYQPKGEYQPKGDYATKTELEGYQPKGEYATKEELGGYQPKGDYATKEELGGYVSKDDLDGLGNFATKEDLEGLGDVSYTEVGDVDMDDLFDQEDMETTDVGDAPTVDFDSLS